MSESELAFVGMGSNLQDPVSQLKLAFNALAEETDILDPVGSSLYTTDPMGPSDQPGYVNAVCSVRTQLAPIALLDLLQSIEQKHGRRRDGTRWGARTLDLDLLLYGQEIISLERLTVPHPGVTFRSFVLVPLLEIAPDIQIPEKGCARGFLATVEMYNISKMEATL